MHKISMLIISLLVAPLCFGAISPEVSVADTSTAMQNAKTVAGTGPSNTNPDDFRITVSEAVRVGRSWKVQMFFKYTAPEGFEIVVLRIIVERTGEKDALEVRVAELLLADGAKSVSPAKSQSYKFPSKGKQQFELPFFVPQGFKLKTLLYGKQVFDLSTLPVADKTAETATKN